MELVKNYHLYDENTGVFISTISKNINPAYVEYVNKYGQPKENITLIDFPNIPNSTSTEPPAEASKVAVWNDGKWQLKPDYRDTILYQYDKNNAIWVEVKGHIGELESNMRLVRPEEYETPDGIDLEKLRIFKKKELDNSYSEAKQIDFKNHTIGFNHYNTQAITAGLISASNTRMYQTKILHLDNQDILIESASEMEQLQNKYNTRQVELYRQNAKQLEFLKKATLDELLVFKTNFGDGNGE